jgi:hypothetical protein
VALASGCGAGWGKARVASTGERVADGHIPERTDQGPREQPAPVIGEYGTITPQNRDVLSLSSGVVRSKPSNWSSSRGGGPGDRARPWDSVDTGPLEVSARNGSTQTLEPHPELKQGEVVGSQAPDRSVLRFRPSQPRGRQAIARVEDRRLSGPVLAGIRSFDGAVAGMDGGLRQALRFDSFVPTPSAEFASGTPLPCNQPSGTRGAGTPSSRCRSAAGEWASGT